MSNDKVSSLVTRARTSIILDHAFFATLILKLQCHENENVKTAATNGKEIAYNPKYLGGLSLKEVVAVLAHEILHCIFGHHTRIGNRDLKLWNIACDLAINPLLLEYGFQLPSGVLIEPSLKGLTAEEIYNLIERDSNGLGKYKDPNIQYVSMGDVEGAVDENGDPASEAEKSFQEVDWKISTTQAANLASKAGTLPAGLKRLLEDHINPNLPWEEILYKFMDNYSLNDFSWSPPNRKYMNSGFYFPSVRSKELGNIFFGCDASGSVRNKELGLMSSSLNYISASFRCNMKAMWFDTKVHDEQNFEVGDLIELHPVGGGGTDFRAPFNYMEEKGIYPNVLIIFTDLECSSYPEPPEFPVIWVTWKKHYTPPPFGEVIVM